MSEQLIRELGKFMNKFIDAANVTLPPQTCPKINSAIKSVACALKVADDASRKGRDESDLREALDEVTSELYGVEDDLEVLRQDNDTLRTAAEELIEFQAWAQVLAANLEFMPTKAPTVW